MDKEKDVEREEVLVCSAELKTKEALLPRIISLILHPLFMGLYGVCLLFVYTDMSFIFAGQFLRFITPVFFLSCVVPGSSIFLLKSLGIIQDYELRDKNERLLPFLIAFVAYALLVYYFFKAGLYVWFIAVLSAPLCLLLIGMLISPYWKISTHMMGIGGLIGCTLSVCYNIKGLNPYILFIILFILAGSLGVSRLMLNRHTPAQVYVGFAVGFVVSYICVLVGAYWGFFWS